MEVTKDLLMHWWNNYMTAFCLVEYTKEFEKVIEQYGEEKVLMAAICSFLHGDGHPDFMLKLIIDENVEEFFSTLPDMSRQSEKSKADYNEVRKEFLSQISKTFNIEGDK